MVLPNIRSSAKFIVFTSLDGDTVPLVKLCVRGREGRVSAYFVCRMTSCIGKQYRG